MGTVSIKDVAQLAQVSPGTASNVLNRTASGRLPTYKLGQIAAELLLEECGDPAAHAHRQIMFQPELVVRESTGRAGRGGDHPTSSDE
ncbi:MULTISPECIES: hypothetical protein [Streptosporangium]|uniref:DNA-binding LacI/PurR family transcriptional regulator n=1 Tax=Streptosporangium brasiliense TaxID=47480 RepID=A0ABT9R377_9ACTN|nr:hypothetical protein [Streptosporangium brasiliense]MDP9863688.1 DNA-binding LacI/PurR family transcriptional regulator [Streptosporangium brasiliense]